MRDQAGRSKTAGSGAGTRRGSVAARSSPVRTSRPRRSRRPTELDLLTMRGLARELGVTATALYTHVENKGRHPRPDHRPGAGARGARSAGRDRRLEGVDRRGRGAPAVRAHSVFSPARSVQRRRPVGVPAALSRMEAALAVLRSAGFDEEAAMAAYATIHTYTLGFAALEIAREMSCRQHPTREDGALTEASPHYWPVFFAGLSADEYPNLTRLKPDLTEFTTDELGNPRLLPHRGTGAWCPLVRDRSRACRCGARSAR